MARPRRPLSSFRLQRVMERSSPDHGAVIPPFYAGGVLVRETTAHSPPQYAGLDMSTQKEKENTSMAQALTYTLESTSGSNVEEVAMDGRGWRHTEVTRPHAALRRVSEARHQATHRLMHRQTMKGQDHGHCKKDEARVGGNCDRRRPYRRQRHGLRHHTKRKLARRGSRDKR